MLEPNTNVICHCVVWTSFLP